MTSTTIESGSMLDLNTHTLDQHFPHRQPHVVRKRHSFYSSGPNGLYLIVNGYARAFRILDNCKEATTWIAGPGEFIGDAVFSRGLMLERAESISEVSYVYYDRADIAAAAAKDAADFYAALAHHLRNRLNWIETMAVIGRLRVGERLRIVLTDLSNRLGIFSDDHNAMVIPTGIKHELLATMVHSTREQVTQAMVIMRLEGQLDYTPHRIVLLKRFFK